MFFSTRRWAMAPPVMPPPITVTFLRWAINPPLLWVALQGTKRVAFARVAHMSDDGCRRSLAAV
jgi:hypothetical protein